MKCPHCSEETKDGKACERCGKDLGSSQGMEVQYKDFKVSELLDIKMTKQTPSGKEMEKPRAVQEKVLKKTLPEVPQPAAKKIPGIVVTAGIVVLAAIAVFFLLRFLFKF